MLSTLLSVSTSTVLLLSGLGLQSATASGYPPCTITGTAADETITGTTGNDVICTGGGNDIINADTGNDIIIVSGPGVNTIDAGTGNDIVDASLGTDSTIDGGTGDDTIYAGGGHNTISGGTGDDIIYASLGTDSTIDGGTGNDTIYAGFGNDTIAGDTGNDTIFGGGGNDLIAGGTGIEIISGGTGNDQIAGGTGADDISGGTGNDQLVGGTGDDTIFGGTGTDTLIGNEDNDNLVGGAGNDNLEGSAGNDNLYGQLGVDTLSGSAGDDLLVGGEGLDSLDGGASLNTCDFSGGESTTPTCEYGYGAPTLASGSVSTGPVEVGSSAGSVHISMHVTDENGIAAARVVCMSSVEGREDVALIYDFSSSNLQSEIGQESNIVRSGDSKDFTIDFDSTVTQGIFPGTYTCSAYARDTLWNQSEPIIIGTFTVLRTPVGLPSAPRSLVFIPSGPTAGSLGWVAPDFVGSPSLNAYIAQYSVDGTSWVDLADGAVVSTSIPLAGLKPDTDYWFRVRGENGGTVGQDTSFMNLGWNVLKVHTPSVAVPVAPTALSVSNVFSSGFRLVWSAPSNNGGVSISDFSVEASRDNGVSWLVVRKSVSTAMSLTVSGANPGTTYLVRVAAVNAVGASEYLTGSVTTLTTTASAPKSLVASNINSSSVSLGWSGVDSTGGAAVTDYQVEVSTNGSDSWTLIRHSASVTRSFNVSNLQSGTTYLFRVAAVTAAGLGDYSNVMPVSTVSAKKPVAPAELVVSKVKLDDARLSWSGVLATQKITDYLVELSTDGTTWTSVSKKASASTSLAITGLKLGVTYQVRVAALNSIGTGAYVYSSFTTLPTVSTAPTALVASSVASSSFTLNWSAPTVNGGSLVSDYVVEINGGGYNWSPVDHDASTATGITISGLQAGVKYSVRVKAVNGAGVSKVSSTVTATTPAVLPSTPALALTSVSTTGAVISWIDPTNGLAKSSKSVPAKNSDSVLVEYSTDNGQTWKTVGKTALASTTLTMKGLKTKTSYLVRISAKNSAGFSAYSQNLVIITN